MPTQYSNHRDTPLRRFNTFWWGLTYFGIFGVVSAVVYWSTDETPDVTDMLKNERMEVRTEVDASQIEKMNSKDMSGAEGSMMTTPKASNIPHPDAGASAEPVDPALIAKGKEVYLAKGCIACHGADGNTPPAPMYPKLGGKSSAYLLKQMQDIKSGVRTTQLTPMMKPTISQCSDEDMKAIAAWLGSKK